MKKIILSISIFICILFTSCTKDETGNLSRITVYPIITLNGESTVILNVGQTYTELGAGALAGTQVLPLTTVGSVNTSTPGVYKVEYSTTNNDGYPASGTRTVIVLKNTLSTVNLAGVFVRNGTNVNNVTRISDRVYKCDNATGFTTGNPNNISLTFYNLDDSKIYAPLQFEASSTGLSAESNIGTIVSANSFKWVIFASGFFGTAVRTFVRQ